MLAIETTNGQAPHGAIANACGTKTITSALTSLVRTDGRTRQEFLALARTGRDG